MKITLSHYTMYLPEHSRERKWKKYENFFLSPADVSIIKSHMVCRLKPRYTRAH